MQQKVFSISSAQHSASTISPNSHCTQVLVQETQHGQDKTSHYTHRTKQHRQVEAARADPCAL